MKQSKAKQNKTKRNNTENRWNVFGLFSCVCACAWMYIYVCAYVRLCVCVRARGHACVWVCGCPKTHRFGQMPAKTAIDIARIVKLWLFYWNDKSNTFDMTNWLPRLMKSSRWCWCRKCWFCDAHLIEILWRIMAVYHCVKKSPIC